MAETNWPVLLGRRIAKVAEELRRYGSGPNGLQRLGDVVIPGDGIKAGTKLKDLDMDTNHQPTMELKGLFFTDPAIAWKEAAKQGERRPGSLIVWGLSPNGSLAFVEVLLFASAEQSGISRIYFDGNSCPLEIVRRSKGDPVDMMVALTDVVGKWANQALKEAGRMAVIRQQLADEDANLRKA